MIHCDEAVHKILWNKFGKGKCFSCRLDLYQEKNKKEDRCSCGGELKDMIEYKICSLCSIQTFNIILPQFRTKVNFYTPEKIGLPKVYNRLEATCGFHFSLPMKALIVNIINAIRKHDFLMKDKKRLTGYANICMFILLETEENVNILLKNRTVRSLIKNKKYRVFWNLVKTTSVNKVLKEGIKSLEEEGLPLFYLV